MAYKRISPMPVEEGGTGAITLTDHAVIVGSGTAAVSFVGPVAATGAVLMSNGVGSDPGFSTATYPATTTINEILYSSAANTVVGITAANNGTLISSATGVPSFLANGTTGQVLTATTGSPPSWATPPVSGATITQFDVLVGGPGNTIDSVGPGTAGQVLQSGGAGANPAYSTATYPATTGINEILYSSSANVVGGITASNNGVLISGATGIPSWLAAGTTGQVLTATTGSPPTWAAAGGTGDVVGPAGATPTAIAVYDGATGKIIANSIPTIDSSGNIVTSASLNGSTLSIDVVNSSNTSGSSARMSTTVAGSTAADPHFQASVSGGQVWTFGLDNSDSDAFALASSAVLGTTNIMRASTAGEINYPLQPAFLAYLGTTDTNVTGDGTNFVIGSGNALTEVFDQNGDFVTTGTFTAPVTGRYLFTVEIYVQDVTTVQWNQFINTSNRAYRQDRGASTAIFPANMSSLTDMDAADTCTFSILVFDAGGKIIDIFGTTSPFTWCSGYLAC